MTHQESGRSTEHGSMCAHVWQCWLFWSALLLVSCAAPRSRNAAHAENPQSDSMSILIHAQRIETARIWEDGSPSAQSEALLAILERDDAASAFVALFESASAVAGQLYALLGLSRCSPQQYAVLAEVLNPDQVVPVLWYDVMRRMRVSEVLELIQSGTLYSVVCCP